jgi:hypothetical protein
MRSDPELTAARRRLGFGAAVVGSGFEQIVGEAAVAIVGKAEDQLATMIVGKLPGEYALLLALPGHEPIYCATTRAAIIAASLGFVDEDGGDDPR